jgi:hypothetical protein
LIDSGVPRRSKVGGNRSRKLYALRGVPTSVVVGSDGVVRAVNRGPIDAAVLQRYLTEMLSR